MSVLNDKLFSPLLLKFLDRYIITFNYTLFSGYAVRTVCFGDVQNQYPLFPLIFNVLLYAA